jgi:long-chain acyl-CoA synthetase
MANTDKRLFDYLAEQLRHTPLDRAFGHQKDGQWVYYSTQQMAEWTHQLSRALLQLGLRPGDRVASVVYQTTPAWVALDYALLQIGVIGVPMYPTISAREYAYILAESEARFCVVGDGDLAEKVLAAQAQVGSLQEVFSFEKNKQHPTLRTLAELIVGLENSDESTQLADIQARIRPDDVATIIYTSGTTGNPKGVVLTHRNVVYNVETMRTLIPINAGEQALSFLPVSHIFERATLYAYTAYGASVAFSTPDNLGGESGDLQQVRPHFFTAVPRLLEKVYEKIYDKGLALRGVKRAIFFWAMSRADRWDFDQTPHGLQGVAARLADRLVFSKWRAALGGRIRGIVIGASACPVRIMRAFNAAGIRVREGYGMTEAAPAVSFSRFEPGGAMLGSVGIPVEGLRVRIETGPDYRPDEGEILVQSPGVMVGYYHQPDKTAEVIREEADGRWLCTGDVGTLVRESDGRTFLKITDRKKELLKTSGGKYVAPTPIEARFKEHHLVEQIMVVGENLKFVSALIVPAVGGLRDWCQKQSIAWTDLQDMVRHPRVLERYQMLVERINPNFGHAEQVKKFALLTQPWEPVKSDGSEAELTPTLKLKRRVIAEKYRQEITQMYE